MKVFEISACGDCWINHAEFSAQLAGVAADETVVLDMQSEAPCLYALGVVDLLDQHGITDVRIVNYPNSIKDLPYTRTGVHLVSHFWWMSERYAPPAPIGWNQKHMYGCFIGRKTVARCVILYEMQKQNSIVSVMDTWSPLPWQESSVGRDLEDIALWQGVADVPAVKQWWSNNSVGSLDGHTVGDQYRPEHNTNLDLLRFYEDFLIEIAIETYTVGNTFFVTEKTVRPLVAGKPFLLFGPRHFLRRLHSLGIQTYNSLWSEHYDEYEGAERWQHMQTSLKEITKLDPKKILEHSQQLAEHNRACIKTIIKEHAPR